MRVVKLLSIELKNWRQLKSFKQDFQHGITCIVGPNGVGKSSLLDAIMFSITETWGEHYKKKSHNIRYGSKGDAYVKARWRINDVDITIEKDLRKNKSRLTLPDGRVITAANAIAFELETLFGASRSLLSSAVFISQGKVDDFLHLTKASWLEYIGQFCDLARIEKIRSVLHDQLNKDSQLLRHDTAQDLKQLRLQLVERKTRLGEIAGLICKFKSKLLDDVAAAKTRASKYRSILLKLRNRNQLRTNVAAAKQKYKDVVARNQPQIDELKQKLAELDAKKEAFAKNSERWFKLVQDADRRKKLVVELAKNKEQLLSALTSANKLEEQIASLQKEVNDIAAQYTTLTRSRVDLSEKEKTLERRIDLLKQGVCPTCGGKLSKSDMKQTKTELDDVSKQLTLSLKAEKEMLQSHTELNNELQQLVHKLDNAKASVGKCKQAIKLHKADLKALPKCSGAKVRKIRNKLVAATMFNSEHRDVATKLESLNAVVTEAKSTYGALKGQLAKTQSLADKYADTKLLAEQTEQLEAAVARHNKAKANLEANKTILEDYRADVVSLRKRIAKCKATAKMQSQLSNWLKDLTEWREILHRDKLQRVIIESYLITQLEKINSWLVRFNCPFSVKLDDDLTLLAKKQDGSLHTVRQLSGGQKTMLAIAFRLSANEQSLLVLDEPTSGVDSDKLDKFAEFLSELSVQLKREGRQLLLVTHDDRLLGRSTNQRKAVFDNVIRFT